MRGHHAWRMGHAGARRALLSAATVVLLGAILIPATNAGASTPKVKNPICSHLRQLGVSAGAHMYCHGPFKPSRPSRVSAGHRLHAASKAPANVDAANTAEDVAPSGVRGYGQSEESVAAVGKYVVEAWNDSTSFFTSCGAPEFKEENTGFGFSADGGKTFHDEGGLPNAACSSGWFFQGDPSVEGFTRGGKTYFYVSSLYINFNTGQSDVALDACQATGTGTGAVLSCNLAPTIVATGASDDFLDKDYLSIDPRRGRLYATFTRFSFPSASNGQIELAVCDISGASAANPICFPGSFNSPYYVVQTANPNCENEGSYPAVNTTTGDVYVAWEFNWATNLFTTACFGVPTRERVAYVPFFCLGMGATSGCTSPAPVRASVKIVSMDAASIPGYNRSLAAQDGLMNDFPRIAVSPKAGMVTIVWNDASKPTGKILMQSYHLLSSSSTSFTKVQSRPLKLNNNKGPTWVFMPGLRNANSSGQLDVIWFDRRKSNPSCEACTDVFAAMHVSPAATMTPAANVRITNVSSNWNAQSSDIVPNFGDYTDDFVAGPLLYAAWADGRIGEPQPFSAHTSG